VDALSKELTVLLCWPQGSDRPWRLPAMANRLLGSVWWSFPGCYSAYLTYAVRSMRWLGLQLDAIEFDSAQ